MRGTGYWNGPSRWYDRIIPGRAGNRNMNYANSTASLDHPRARGEQWVQLAIRGASGGSSPGVRGTEGCAMVQRNNHRIIPGRAGNSCLSVFMSLVWADHPRACGEQWRRRIPLHDHVGSSPGVRGTAQAQPLKATLLRIIPGRAGNRCKTVAITSELMDHPRACGEQSQLLAPWCQATGSHPGVRGTVRPAGR